MFKELKRRISEILEQGRDRNSEKAEKIMTAIEAEFKLMEQAHNWDERDLSVIHARASSLMTNLSGQASLEGKPLRMQDSLARVYCFVQATYEYMRGQQMTPYLIDLQKNKRKLPVCKHDEVVADLEDECWNCLTCKKKVIPLLWAEKPEK